MISLLVQKWQQPDLAKILRETGDKFLIEGNDWNDTFWGITRGRDKNMLGRILMNIRSKILDGTIS